MAAYLRVSSKEQNTSNQTPSIEQYCQSRDWELWEVYQEQESAWQSGHQKELARLLSDLRSGKKKYEHLIIWSLDRLSRLGIAATLQLINSLELLGCRVISIQESWLAESGPMREVFTALASWAAKYESDRRSERTLAGLARAKKNGKQLGRPRGSRDKGKRKKAGYINRWLNKGSARIIPDALAIQGENKQRVVF